MIVREYGASGPTVIVLHGGPGAPGTMEPVARELASSFRVLEPFQRRSGGAPLAVATHVADLAGLLSDFGEPGPALVGHSWGAMLALACAAAHPVRIAAIVLIGCGTFDRQARERLRATREGRMDDAVRRRLAVLAEEHPDEDERLAALGDLMLGTDAYDPVPGGLGIVACDARGYREAWGDMLRLQDEGVYPAAFGAIDAPVLMIHGAEDPHAGRMTRDLLAKHIRRLEFVELDRCGHYPWLERAARSDFFSTMRRWLSANLGAAFP